MRRMIVVSLIVSGVAGGAVRSGWAAEQSGLSAQPPAASTKSSVVTPSLMTVQGQITALNLTSTPAQVTLATGDSTLILTLDSKDTSVWKGVTAVPASQLQVGQRVKVRYWEPGGQQIAKSIAILPPAVRPATASTPPSAPQGGTGGGAASSSAQ